MPTPPSRHAARRAVRYVPAVALLTLLGSALALPPDELELDPRFHHLGDDETPEWTEAPLAPEGHELAWTFAGTGYRGEAVLRLRQRHVDDAWTLALNGTELGELERVAELVEREYVVPAGLLREGDNRLELRGSTTTDDITVGELRLLLQSMRELYDLQTVWLNVMGSVPGESLPARVTIVAADGSRPRFRTPGEGQLALRDGLLYVGPERAAVELPAGQYTAYATRGSEWSLDTVEFRVGDTAPPRLDFRLERVVDTTGWIAADTHIHTYGWSNHGDAVPVERQLTLAGEGVELAVATDHNHQSDFRPVQARMGLERWYTPVMGNEVTTSVGHFNAFPFEPEDRLPDASLTEWAAIVADIRAAGAEFVILNHPRWPDLERGPFGVVGLDRASGERLSGGPLTFDAIELVNSTDLKQDPLYLLQDWFALLDRGEWLTAAGSSDSHTVADPVGQGRTWVPSSTDDPAAIDVEEAVAAFRAGRTTVGLGIFLTLSSAGRSLPGATLDLSTREGLPLTVHIGAPEWVTPREVVLFANGEEVGRVALEDTEGPTSTDVAFALARPPHDAWLVAVALGDGIDGPWWPTQRPYTFACSNPVRLDVDGDGYRSPRETALALLSGAEDDGAIAALLGECGEGIAVQLLAAARERFRSEAEERFARVGAGALDRGPRVGEYVEPETHR